LRRYEPETIRDALRRCRTAHEEFPPSLPQFLALCESVVPRPVSTAVHPNYTPAITMSPEARKAWRTGKLQQAREALQKRCPPAEGLDALKQAIGAAVREAGGDEAATLLQLDRIFTPRKKA
jgi:hypothetical protein